MMKKLSLSLLAIAAVSALVMGATFALFTANATNAGNTFTAGTVTFADDATAFTDVTNIAPGDSDSDTYTVTYVGSLDAFVGADLKLTGGLFTCDGTPMVVSMNGDSESGTDRSQVVQTHALLAGGTSNIFKSGDVASITVAWRLPATAGNACQGKQGHIALKVYAVQATNNTAAGGAGPTSWGN